MPEPSAVRRLLNPLSLGVLALGLAACQPAPPADTWTGYAEGDFLYLSAPVAGALRELPVRAGQTVAAGDRLFVLDATPHQAARAEADARWRAAQALADHGAQARRPSEQAMAQAQQAQARAAAALADDALRRQQALQAQGFVSAAALEQAQATQRQAQARLAELQAALDTARQPLSRPQEQRAAQASAQAAAHAREQAQWREAQAQQTAPVAALVADTYAQPGEWVGAGQPVLALLPPDARRARFFVPEAALGRLRPGQAVQILCDGCGAPLAGRIRHIAAQAEYTPPVLYSRQQRDRLVFRVEAVPEPADAPRLHPGQPVEVRLWPQTAGGGR